MADPQPPVMPPPLDPKIVVEIIRCLFVQWVAVIAGVGWIAADKNYNINPVLIPIIAGVVAAEITWIGQIVNWGVGSSIGSIMKNMALRMAGQQPAVTVSPQPDSKTTVTTETPKPEEGTK